MPVHPLNRALTSVGTFLSRPWAFLILISYAVLWTIFQPDTLNWHGIATLVTWGMTLFIQRAEHRDTQALQAKLDELLRATGAARNEFTRIDEKEPEEIEGQRSAEQRHQ
jgi:low affinity Fe/Cu permease